MSGGQREAQRAGTEEARTGRLKRQDPGAGRYERLLYPSFNFSLCLNISIIEVGEHSAPHLGGLFHQEQKLIFPQALWARVSEATAGPSAGAPRKAPMMAPGGQPSASPLQGSKPSFMPGPAEGWQVSGRQPPASAGPVLHGGTSAPAAPTPWRAPCSLLLLFVYLKVSRFWSCPSSSRGPVAFLWRLQACIVKALNRGTEVK